MQMLGQRLYQALFHDDFREGAFTLLEVLVTVVIIGVLSSIAITAYANQREKAIEATVSSDVTTNRNLIPNTDANHTGVVSSLDEFSNKTVTLTGENYAKYYTMGNMNSACLQVSHDHYKRTISYYYSTDTAHTTAGTVTEGECSDLPGVPDEHVTIGDPRPEDGKDETDPSEEETDETVPDDGDNETPPVPDESEEPAPGEDEEPAPGDDGEPAPGDDGDNTPGENEETPRGEDAGNTHPEDEETTPEEDITALKPETDGGLMILVFQCEKPSRINIQASPFTGIETWDSGERVEHNGSNGVSVGKRLDTSEHILRLDGTFSKFRMVGKGNECLREIRRWDDATGTVDATHTFSVDASNLVHVKEIPSTLKSTSGMFNGATKFNDDISHWDVSNVEDMSNMFQNADSFNQDISRWNVSGVKDMSRMFRDADSFNQDLSEWDVSSVSNHKHAFQNASSMSKKNQPQFR